MTIDDGAQRPVVCGPIRARLRIHHFSALIVAVVVAGVAVAACAPSLEDLTPFPCAADGTCPRGLSCTPTVGCVAAQLDSPCVAETNCAGAAEGAVCALGLCSVACDERRPCDARHVCSTSTAAGAGICVPSCGADPACPPGLSCRPLGYGEAKGCLGGGGNAALDGPCATNEQCAAAGSATKCVDGVCSTACGATLPCDATHLCSSYENRSDGSCLIDCSASGQCPQGLECKPVGYESKRVCAGAGQTVAACESDVAIDPKNCGACGKACGPNQGCANGKCTCANGALACGDLCVDGATDPRNCGACGHDCFGGACKSGSCGVVTYPGTTDENAFAWVDDTSAYFNDNGTHPAAYVRWVVRRVDLATGKQDTVLDHMFNDGVDQGLVIDGQTLYLAIQQPSALGRVVKMAFNGSVETPLFNYSIQPTSHFGPRILKVVDGELLFTKAFSWCGDGGNAFGTEFLGRASTASGSAVNFIESSPGQADSYAVIAGKYYGPASGGIGIEANIPCQCCGGFNPAKLDPFVTLPGGFVAMKADGNTLFVLGDSRIDSVDVSSKPPTVKMLAVGIKTPLAMVLDATHVYWLDQGTGPAFTDAAVRRVPRTGGPIETRTLFAGPSLSRQGVRGGKRGFVWVDGTGIRFAPN